MSSLNLQARLRRLEQLVHTVVTRNVGVLWHAGRIQKAAGVPVVLSVTHVGTSLVYRVYCLAPDHTPQDLLSEINPRQIHHMHQTETLTQWFELTTEGDIRAIAPPSLSALPHLTPAVLTCFHPLGEAVVMVDEGTIALPMVVGAN